MAQIAVRTSPRGGWWCRSCGNWFYKPGSGAVWCSHTMGEHEYVWRPVTVEVDGRAELKSRFQVWQDAVDKLTDVERAAMRRDGFRV